MRIVNIQCTFYDYIKRDNSSKTKKIQLNLCKNGSNAVKTLILSLKTIEIINSSISAGPMGPSITVIYKRENSFEKYKNTKIRNNVRSLLITKPRNKWLKPKSL